MLKDRIIEKVSRLKNVFKIKVSVLSRKIGLDERTISEILTGETKNPGIYTIAKIADVLNCSVDELIADSSNNKSTDLKIQLAKSCTTITVSLLRKKQQKVRFEDFLFILREIYTCSLNKKIVDEKFAAQYINKFLSDKNVKG